MAKRVSRVFTFKSRRTTIVDDDDSLFGVVVAIDFGTTYSGYAFSSVGEPAKIFMNKVWGKGVESINVKTPTSVLMRRDGGRYLFEQFGAEAERLYSEENDHLFLFRHFKMMLHDMQVVNRNIMVSSITGTTQLLAFDLIKVVLTVIKDNLLDHLSRMGKEGNFSLKDIRWVLTVPAIWSDASKRIMREAAWKAGLIGKIDSQKLVLALEPEAAALYCRDSRVKDHFAELQPGTQYMVIDAGGGTVDIAVHQVVDDNKAKEIYMPTGGPWGSNKVNQLFEEIMSNVLGEDVIQNIKEREPSSWMGFMNEFEGSKRSATRGQNIRFHMPYGLSQSYRKVTGKNIDSAFKSMDNVRLRSGQVDISWQTVDGIFSECIQSIISHVGTLLLNPKLKLVKHLMFVGGFSECSLLQDAVKDRFGEHFNIIIPHNTALAVVQGAVLFGHNVKSIESRCSTKTYGTLVWPEYDDKIHDPKYRFHWEGKDLCNHKFLPFVKKDEVVTDGYVKEYDFLPSVKAEHEMRFELFSSPDPDVQYTDEPGVVKVNELTIPVTRTKKDKKRPVHVQVTFGGTEIHMAVKRSDGKSISTKFEAN